MPRVIEKTVYKFDELSDRAKEKAREWWRRGMCNDWEPEFSEFETLAQVLGIEFKHRQSRGGTHTDPVIHYSVGDRGEFCSYEGTWTPKVSTLDDFKALGWGDSDGTRDVLAIAEALTRAALFVQLSGPADLTALVSCRGRDDDIMDVEFTADLLSEFDDPDEGEVKRLPVEIRDSVTEALKDFAGYMLGYMRDDYEYQYSDECVDQYLEEYEFDEDGDCA